MQAGSELGWHMSGLFFAKDKESALFSSTNLVTSGIRGCIVPALGALLLTFIPCVGVLSLGIGVCLFATWHLFLQSKKKVALVTT
jgi:hypothetical protein